MTIRAGLVGLGKIARDQHLPAMARTAGIDLIAIASRNARGDGVHNYPDLGAMLAGEPDLDAIILCQPPQARYHAARQALLAGKHVFLEKPPGATVSEVEALIALAKAQNVTLYASWHSRYAAAVAQAKAWIAQRRIERISIQWREDVRHWHPGQPWIWEAGGFGVFDPGINALSILTEIVPEPVTLLSASLEIPSNKDAPIGATLAMATASGAPIDTVFDWRQTGPQTWDIAVDTDNGNLLLSEGGNMLRLDGEVQMKAPDEEYPAMYRRFVDLVATRTIDADIAPLRLVADAFLCGRHCPTAIFED
ncbi:MULTISPECIES: Gfo/Idh/MocA family protein [unclassified Sphingobium]|uniref:Gfo/Idh/MocA family protein n=1 Tax=unclassified Sphingobium TaxID=2611147 RepID=UPI000D17E340|nr:MULTISPECIES: Gfo/Idh/MocA family oxidoreductase [unclassified Sphingobium]MBG6117507.1 putative dehydrogenase [Sphingobium sp. JAI105]PSO12582.1 galactose 1-dehydrogenase [Sphingobium sp. AEW4]TWD09758.1 D-galactose 1-dehydrogenase/L-arabinose 1- dehydrogenase [Sphingobium sp. AEW010]TWD26429.1 D-galactose 1-dehydrogenase/L-arabinose 1- dehydrogenase [Sphingobium sp. AEW013]TWD27802.1 D-galactose 1-dehydrogenase/L-arabinose 1- dehydrogenase [Sphingobium sp. AEW001]